MVRHLVALGAAASLTLGCDGAPQPGAPLVPAVPALEAGTVLTFVGAGTGLPVGGAVVELAGARHTSDAEGRVAVARAVALEPPPPIDVFSDGHLDRRTTVRAEDERRFSLWPRTAPGGFDEAFTAALVYTPPDCPFDAGGRGASQSLRRPARGAQVLLALEPSLSSAEGVRRSHQQAVDALNAALRGLLTLTVTDERPPSGVVFDVVVDPGHASCPGPEPFRATVDLVLHPSQEITGGRITYCSAAAARLDDLVLHELGHVVGLRHGPDRRDVMYCSAGRARAFSGREVLVMRLLFERRPGNYFPDHDRTSIGALSAAVERAACAAE